MHHSTVQVFERPRSEDGDGVKITVDGVKVTTKNVPEEDMPGRRNSVRLAFACWCCQNNSVLLIEQHKGVTNVEWMGNPSPVRLEPE